MQCSRYNKFYIVELDCYLAIGSFFCTIYRNKGKDSSIFPNTLITSCFEQQKVSSGLSLRTLKLIIFPPKQIASQYQQNPQPSHMRSSTLLLHISLASHFQFFDKPISIFSLGFFCLVCQRSEERRVGKEC